MIKFLPTYVGSKQYWVSRLEEFKNKDFIEPFCGSAALSANLAKTAILADADPMVCKILENFDKLIVPETFTEEDYFKYRKDPEWWKYIYVLQKMSFSGVFRYSKNGYNVPIKKPKDSSGQVTTLAAVSCKEEYQTALTRWRELKPTILHKSYIDLDSQLFENKVVILDPPYEASQASYNSSKFNYALYWTTVEHLKNIADTVLIFDRESNLQAQNIPVCMTRKMRVNGARQGDQEALGIFTAGAWRT